MPTLSLCLVANSRPVRGSGRASPPTPPRSRSLKALWSQYWGSRASDCFHSPANLAAVRLCPVTITANKYY
eukprot:350050-Prorocentrum_minimum.AAC.1